MRLFAWTFLAVTLLIAVPTGMADDGKQTLKGSYEWTGGKSGELTAYFFPTDETDKWTVEFRFDFHGPHLYTGTATGSLKHGDLSGEVVSDQRRRTFVFRGAFEDGAFTGTHAETTRGGETATGTMTLK
jgi:hypothetical protein